MKDLMREAVAQEDRNPKYGREAGICTVLFRRSLTGKTITFICLRPDSPVREEG